MSAAVLTNVQLLMGGFELGPFTGSFDVSETAAMVPALNFGALGYNVVVPGVFTAAASLKGHSDFATGAVNATFGSSSKGSQFAYSVLPVGSATVAGDPAFLMRGLLSQMKMYIGKTGDIADFEMSLAGDTAGADGFVLAPLASRTTAGLTGTSVTAGAVSATQRAYAALHVTVAAGTNLVVKVQSAPASNFASPTDRITFSTVSATGWQFSSVAGPITDTFWRALVTIASVTFTFAVTMGII